MLVCVVRDCSLEKFIHNIMPSLPKVDLVLFSYNTIQTINYEDEILEKTSYIKTFLNISKQLNCVVCAGSYFELLDQNYASILVCDKGELLGIVDSLEHTTKNKMKAIKLFITTLGSMTVLVNNDLLNKKLTTLVNKLEPNIIINIAEDANIKVWNETLQKQAQEQKPNFISLTSKTTFYKENNSNEVKLNFCEFFTKDFKM